MFLLFFLLEVSNPLLYRDKIENERKGDKNDE